MRVRTMSSRVAPPCSSALRMISKHRRACGAAPSGHPPPGRTGPVPDTRSLSPTRSARLKPMVGSKGEPDAMR